MNADHHFWIGKTHKVCEDYALSGEKDGKYYAIVSDGCSSSPNTDWGSRIIAKAAERSLDFFPYNFTAFTASVIAESNVLRKAASLDAYSLDATLLIAATHDDNVTVACYGDGGFAFIYPEFIHLHYIEYPSGAPLYLNYLSNKERLDIYKNETNLKRYIHEYNIYPGGASQFSPVNHPEKLNNIGFTVTKNIKNILAVAVMSDGISSYVQSVNAETTKFQQEIAVQNIVKELLSFKSYNGIFVQRRVQKFIKQCEKDRLKNIDDVSIAALCFK